MAHLFKKLLSFHGFTLIEILISVSILSIVTAVGVLNLTNYKNKHSLELDATSIVEVLRSAQNKALLGEGNSAWSVRFSSDTNENSVELFQGSVYATSTVLLKQPLSFAVRFTDPYPGSTKTITFAQGTGMPNTSQSFAVRTRGGSFVSLITMNSVGSVRQSLDSKLVGAWSFNEGSGTTTYDASGQYPGTLYNSPTWTSFTSCKLGSCLSFDGSTQYVDIPGFTNVSAYTEGTISFVVYLTRWSGYDNMLGLQSTATNNNTIRFEHDAGKIRVVFGNSSGVYSDAYSTSTISTGTWHHVALTWNTASNSATVYVDADAKTSSITTWPSTYAAFRIGSAYAGRYMAGRVDDVRLYNRALSATEITSIYKSY